ncbi:MAG: UDP-glucose 4-epimerase GalE [Terracidiphilus sp.]
MLFYGHLTSSGTAMRVVVTGGSGYVGSAAVRALSDAGHSIVIYDNLSTGHPKLSRGFELIRGDIGDRDRVLSCLRDADAVMHFAASAYVEESVVNPRKYFHNNVESALILLDAVLQSNVRLFIFSSSCAIYGVPQSLPIVESAPKDPINPYGATKLFIEHVLSAYSLAHGLRYVALRYFNAAGAHPSGEIGEIHNPETHLIPLALRAALNLGSPLTVFGNQLPTPDGTCVRDFIHVSDLADAHLRALKYLAEGGSSLALNLGTGKGTSIAELLRVIEEISGRKVPHHIVDPRPGDPPILFADSSKAREVLGWQPAFGIREVIQSALHWEENLQSFLSAP